MKKRVLLFALALLLTFSLFPSISYADVTTDLDYACRIAATQTWYWPFSTANITDAYGKITSSYGYRKDEAQGLDSVHYGLDIGMQKNTPVYPIQSGFVTYIKSSNSGSRGRYLIIKHDNGFCSMYLHLQEIKVNNGDRVYPSTEIALSGGSGKGSDNGYANHLHFQILYGNPNSSGIIENNLSINPCPAGYTRKGSSFVKGYPMENASDNGGKKFSDNNPRVSYIAMDRSMPTCTHTQGYETVNEGGRYFARCKECHEEYNPEFISDSAGTYRITSNIKLNSAPYQEAQTSVSCKIGQQVTIRGHVINAYNNKWYQTTDGYYIYHEYAELVQQTSTLSVSGHIGNPGTPTGTLTPGSNFGLRGIISSNYTITNVETHIFNSDGSNAVTPYYQTSWNKTSYNIQTDGINNFFSFRSLPINSEANPSYRYVVAASDASANVMRILIDSWFTVGTSTSPVQQYLDQCKSEPCDVTLTVTEPGHMNIMPCSTQTNPQAATVSDDDKNLTVGNTYHSTVRWTNTVGHIWYETTSKNGQRGFIYSGDVSVTTVINIGDYSDPNINSTLSISEYEGGIPAGNLVQGSNYGLRGVISSNYTITHIEAHIYKSDGTDALPSYSTDWNSTSYDIRTDGINNHFNFRDLPTGTNYNYSVHASDSSGTSLPLIDSYFNVGTSSTSTLTYLNLDGLLDGAPNDGLAQYGTADVYINGQLVANTCNDYWEAWPKGTTYEIKNIVANPGYHYNGVYSGSLSGTIGTERVNVVLSFGINTSGVCGDSITWRLEDDKLFIEGTGEMYDYFYYPPWYSSRLSIKEVRISDGVTTIGNDTCHYCTNLESVSIPDSITSIGVSAFSECSSLASIKIPENVTRIDDYAFYYCEKLTDIRIPNNVAYIGEWAFIGCTNLKSFTIPDSVSYIGTYAFCGCNSLTSVVIPKYVTSIGEYTFSGCSNMESVTIPGSVTTIDNHAFKSCYNLRDVYYYGTEAQWRQIKVASSNESLTGATIHYEKQPDFFLPASLTELGEEAFTGGVFSYVRLSENTVTIGSRTFADCPNLTYIYIPAATKTIAADAFAGVDGLTILGASGSNAETYATAHGYTFIAVH